MKFCALILATVCTLVLGGGVSIDGDTIARLKKGEKARDILRIQAPSSQAPQNVRVQDDIPSVGAYVVDFSPATTVEIATPYGMCIDNKYGNSEFTEYVYTADNYYGVIPGPVYHFNVTYYDEPGCPDNAEVKVEEMVLFSSYNTTDSCGSGTVATDPGYFMETDGWNDENGLVVYYYYTNNECAGGDSKDPGDYYSGVLESPYTCNCQNMTMTYSNNHEDILLYSYTDSSCDTVEYYTGFPPSTTCVIPDSDDDGDDDDDEVVDDIEGSFDENADIAYGLRYVQYSSSNDDDVAGADDDDDDDDGKVSQGSLDVAVAMVFVALVMGIGCGYYYFKRQNGGNSAMADQRY